MGDDNIVALKGAIQVNHLIERIMREIRRRTRVAGAFADRHSGIDAGVGQAASHRDR